MLRQNFRLVCSVILLLWGCFPAAGCSSLQSLEDVTATESKKQGRLHERLEKFTKALYWGSLGEASSYVEPSLRAEFYRHERRMREGQRLVDLEISDIAFNNEGEEAEVEIKVKYYKQTHYIVKTRYDRQVWQFRRFQGGWYCQEIERDIDRDAVEQDGADAGRASLRSGQ